MSEPASGQDSVSKAIWPWREAASRQAPTAAHGNVKARALLQTIIMAAVAGVFFYRRHPVPGAILSALAVMMLTGGCFFPSFFLALERAGRRFGQWVGTGLTWLLLVPFFYLCFIPARIILLLTGKDPLNREFPSKAATLWVPRPPVKDPGQYRKQF